MKIFFSPKCLEYEFPGHPESPLRVRATCELLKESGWEFAEPAPCGEEDLLAVHTKALVDSVKTGSFYDPDTPALPGMFDYALLAAGSALRAMECALGASAGADGGAQRGGTADGGAPRGGGAFSLMRPPGHHAGRRQLGGFCYFNNMAAAVAKALSMVERAAIVDIDCHHGNGTEEIFLGNRRVLFVSLHQSPLYPGTGLFSEGNCLNYPLKPGTDGAGYLAALEKALEKVKAFDPGVVGVSAGFDTYRNDPITGLLLDVEDYFKIGELIGGLGKPTFSVLEGGYDRGIPACIERYLEGVSGAR
jgi:acetoin utilization deacetylase AcuC-like enzyme